MKDGDQIEPATAFGVRDPIKQYMKEEKTTSQFVLCIRNEDCEDLELRKVYQALPDEEAAEDGYIRAIDESGEDYLYPQDYFVLVELSRAAEEAILTAA